MKITEGKVIELLSEAKTVLLLEPQYNRKWMPLGLSKIATFVKANGGKVDFSRFPPLKKYDLICITTLFSTDSKFVLKTIRDCQRSLFTRNSKIIVGGIFASLMPEYIIEKTGADIFVGYSKKLDEYVPDRSIDWGVAEEHKNDLILFSVRGCPNRCAYCMVWRMEPDFYVLSNWKEQIENSDQTSVHLMDNNLLGTPIEHIRAVVDTLNKTGKTVTLHGGVDCRFVTDEKAELLASLSYNDFGFRIAFDRMADDGVFQLAMEKFLKAGLKPKGKSYCYALFNFDDTPQEAFYRSREAFRYGVEPYLMRYKPLSALQNKNDYVGKYWTKKLAMVFQIYWQNYGFNVNDGSLEAFVENYQKLGANTKRLRLTQEDWDKWNYKRK